MPGHTPPLIDTSHITLSEGLTEKLAENTHDQWTRLRIDQGWRRGGKRDDDAKTHADLAPYAELAASQQDHDRQTALETHKAILVLDFEIKQN